MIIKITDSASSIEDIGDHSLYPSRGTLDITRAKSLLDYTPECSLHTGLQKYYDWIRQYTN